MTAGCDRAGHLWSIVLAGGEGRRMCPLIEGWLGQPRPKQYCSFYGAGSLLENTLARLTPITGKERIITIVGQGHRRFLSDLEGLSGCWIEQPEARGTGPGVLLPATFIFEQNPDAAILISPSDHFIFPSRNFQDTVRRAVSVLRSHEDRMVLIGVEPSGPETQYGWIEPGPDSTCAEQPGSGFEGLPVKTFVEKPSLKEARRCYAEGCYWSTMIVLTKVRTLWNLAGQVQPEAVSKFDAVREELIAVRNGLMSKESFRRNLTLAHSEVPPFDFSRDLLTPLADHCLLLPLDNAVWSDLGCPERLAQLVDLTGMEPNVPIELLRTA